jgi:hypothetical protein
MTEDLTAPTTVADHLRAAARIWCQQHSDEVDGLTECYATSSNSFLIEAESAWSDVAWSFVADRRKRCQDDPIPGTGWGVYHLIGHDERIIYVGMSGRPQQRISAHRLEFGPHILRVEWYPCATRVEAYELEGERIAEHAPPFNVQRMPR